MKISIISLIILLSAQISFAGFRCMISRDGDEFWFNHLTLPEDVCSTTVKMTKESGMSKSIEIQFLTQKNSNSMMLMSIDGDQPIQMALFSAVNMLLSGYSLKNEVILLHCDTNVLPPTKTECHGLRAYEKVEDSGPVDDVNGLIEVMK